MRNWNSFLGIIALCGIGNVAFAQYPVIPEAMEKKADSLMAKLGSRADQQFLKVKPIIDAEAKAGKPYIPWAAKPSDLPQSKMVAFPGAEGGGAYSFGGRGGKVYVVTSLEDSGKRNFTRSL